MNYETKKTNTDKNQSDLMAKLILVGDSGVGKTSIILRYTEQVYNLHVSTSIGVDFKSKLINVKNIKVKLLIWDTAGQEKFRGIIPTVYKGSKGVFFVFDVGD